MGPWVRKERCGAERGEGRIEAGKRRLPYHSPSGSAHLFFLLCLVSASTLVTRGRLRTRLPCPFGLIKDQISFLLHIVSRQGWSSFLSLLTFFKKVNKRWSCSPERWHLCALSAVQSRHEMHVHLNILGLSGALREKWRAHFVIAARLVGIQTPILPRFPRIRHTRRQHLGTRVVGRIGLNSRPCDLVGEWQQRRPSVLTISFGKKNYLHIFYTTQYNLDYHSWLPIFPLYSATKFPRVAIRDFA